MSAVSIHIIGIGSPLGADRSGLLAAHELDATGFRERYPDKLIDIDTCRSPALLTAQCVPGQALILLDAYCSSDPVACVRHFSIEDLDTLQRPASTHGFDIRQALALSQALSGENPPVSVIGICAGTTPDAADTLAPDDILKTAFPALLNTLDRAIRELLMSS